MAEVAAVAKPVEITTGRKLYEADEHAWIECQVAALRAGDLDRIDRATLIEYLTEMAGRDRRELESRLVVLYAHILKYRLQPDRATRNWGLTVLEQQRAIRRLLKHLPSLATRTPEILRDVYPDAVQAALLETGADRKAVPREPEFDVAGLLDFAAKIHNDTISIPPPLA